MAALVLLIDGDIYESARVDRNDDVNTSKLSTVAQ